MFGDTWVWDGTRWEEKFPAHSPEPRSGHMMATVNGRVVLYGGAGAGQPVTDPQVTWSWDGTDWTREATPASPKLSNAFCMTGSAEKIVLFNQEEAATANTWVYRTGWTKLSGTAGIQPLSPMMTALPDGAGLVLVGIDPSVGWNEEAWVFGKNQSWTPLSMSARPEGRGASAIVTFRGKVMLFGGANIGEGISFYNDTWLFDGASWTKRPTSAFDPSVRYLHAMAAIDEP